MKHKSIIAALPIFALCFLSNAASAETQILKASTIITMDEKNPRAEAVAFDTVTKKITAIGTLKDVQASAPKATIKDLGATVLMPGFIESHGHPILAGVLTQSPSYWIAPYVGYKTWDDVKAKILKEDAAMPAGQPLIFNGVDRMLQQAPLPTNEVLDPLTPSGRPILVMDNSGHGLYFNSAVIKALGWKDGKPPKDPVGASFGRNPDGTSNGVAYEAAAAMIVALPFFPKALPHPLLQGAKWYAYLASFGITSSSEMGYTSGQYKAYSAYASVPDTPVRLSVYQMSIDPDAAKDVKWPDSSMVRKNGIKLWADGSPWLGTIASSFGYLDNARTRQAQIILGPLGEKGMNYNRLELDQILDKYVPLGYQMSFHCNGDVGLDVVLDAYERALNKYKLLGTDHRWRVEHLGGAQPDQFKRAASLGVTVSMAAFQFTYWSDLLDGTMFAPNYGSQWVASASAFKAGTKPTFHNDGPVSPPNPLLDVQSMVTRTSATGKVHGANQQVSLNDALKAITINGAYQLKRDKEVGSLEVGKYADFVELSNDPNAVDPLKLTEQVKVQGTWLGGRKIDTDKFIQEITAIDPSQHKGLAKSTLSTRHSH